MFPKQQGAQLYLAQHPDGVQEVLGGGGLGSTQERKARQKQEKLAYGMELQQQAKMQEEQRRRERNERLGIVEPPLGPRGQPANFSPPRPQPLAMGGGGGYGPPSPGAYGAPPPVPPPPWGSPPGGGMAPPPAAPPWGPPSPGGGGMAPPAPPWGSPPGAGMAPPPWGSPPGGGGFGYPGGYVPPDPPSPPGHMGMGVYPGHMMQPPPMPQQPPPPPMPMQPPPYGGYGPGPMPGMPPPPGGQAFGEPPMPMRQPGQRGGGLAGMHMGGPGVDARSEAQAKKEAYRLELEAQIRAKKEAERRQKEASLEEGRRAMGIADAMGGGPRGGGGGAPFRDPSGHIVADLNAIHRMNQQRDQYDMGGPMYGGGGGFHQMPGAAWGGNPMGGMDMGMGGPGMGGGMGMGMGGPSPFEMADGGKFGGPMGGGGGISPGRGFPGGGMNGGGGGGLGGPPFQQPLGKFRSGNPFATPGELDAKQQQRLELQEALERQIAEKKYRKDMEKQREQEELIREENRLRADQEKIKNAYEEERGGGRAKAGFKTKEEAVADAWQKAKEEAEEKKRKQWEERRKSRSSSNPLSTPRPASPPLPTVQEEASQEAPHPPPPPQQLAPPMPPPPPRPSTQQLSEQVKRLAQGELDKIKSELDSQRASLLAVLEEQNQQLKAAKEHGVHMEEQAESAQAQVNKMRVDMIRGSLAVPESMMRILSDYEPPLKKEAPPSMLDIGLDLPPPAAALRRSLPPNPAFDMGPLIPDVHNPQTVDHGLQRAFLRTPGRAHSRPPTQGMRQLNPLEASLAAESMFIYPNGRELPKHSYPSNNMSQQAAAANDLPFRSLHLSEGLKGMTGAGEKAKDNAAAAQRQPTHEPEVTLERMDLPDGHLEDLESNGPSPRASLAADGGVENAGCRRVVGGGASVEHLNPNPLPPSTADALEKARLELQSGARASAAAAAAASTPADVESLMRQNRDKLSMLKELAALGEAGAVDRVDSFLKRFSNTHASLPENMLTPALRVNTPLAMKAGAPAAKLDAATSTATNTIAPRSPTHQDWSPPVLPPHSPSSIHHHQRQSHSHDLTGTQDALRASYPNPAPALSPQQESSYSSSWAAGSARVPSPVGTQSAAGGAAGDGEQDSSTGRRSSRSSRRGVQQSQEQQHQTLPPPQSPQQLHMDGASQSGGSSMQGPRQSAELSARVPSPVGPPEGIRKRGPKMNDIIFTDNNRPARASVDGNGSPVASSKPSTPLLGEYLNPEALGRNNMLPGPGSSMPPRVPSAGRRAPSAGKPPSSHSLHTAGHLQGGSEAHTGVGGSFSQAVAASGAGSMSGLSGVGLQGPGDSLDAEVGRMAHALPRSTGTSRPNSGRESVMASRSRRQSWGAGGEGRGTNPDLEWMVLGGASKGGGGLASSQTGSRAGGSRRASATGGVLDSTARPEGGALSGMSIPGLPPRTASFSKRISVAGSVASESGPIIAGPPVGGAASGH